jgi:hypothetical protein
MIRGAIELATPEVVQGWIYSEVDSVRDRVVVALSGGACIGTGRVNVYRADLAEVGLGDGNCGFSFPIEVAPNALDSVVVKLDGSDAVLLQSDARVGKDVAKTVEMKRSTVLWHLSRLKWALKRGRISQSDYDYLRILWPTGIYERSLVRRKAADDDVVIDPWRMVARGLFEAYLAFDAEISVREFSFPPDFDKELARIARNPELVVVVALHCKGQATLRVLEGSHVRDGANTNEDNPAVSPAEYPLSPENLIIMDSRLQATLTLLDYATIEVAVAKVPRPV